MTVSTGIWRAIGTDFRSAVRERGWTGEVQKLKQDAQTLSGGKTKTDCDSDKCAGKKSTAKNDL